MNRRRSRPSSSPPPVRYAVLGLGYISQVAVLPAFKHATKNSTLAALVSDDPKKLKTLGSRYGVERLCSYEDADELFASGEIDAVYIALPNSMHADWTFRAAKAGLHVLCEKPMAVTILECERMIEVTRENRVKLMIAYRLHFERANLEAAEIARSGKLGELRYFNSQFSMQVTDEDNIRLRHELGGGPLYDIGIYCINAARAAFAQEPVEIWASVANNGERRFNEVPEAVAAFMRFPKERIASFVCSFGAADRAVYSIVGTKGSITLDPAYEYAEGLAYELRIDDRSRKRKFAKSDQFAPELLYFSDCILNDREPEPSGEEGLMDVRIIEAMNRSIETGDTLTLEAPRKRLQRPTLEQELRRPPVTKPQLIHASPPG